MNWVLTADVIIECEVCNKTLNFMGDDCNLQNMKGESILKGENNIKGKPQQRLL